MSWIIQPSACAEWSVSATTAHATSASGHDEPGDDVADALRERELAAEGARLRRPCRRGGR